MRALFLGAGASAGTVENAPVSRDFGRVLAQVTSRPYEELRRIVALLGYSWSDWPLDQVWRQVDYYSKLHEAISIDAPDPKESGIKHALLEVFGKRCDRASDALPIGANYTLGRLIDSLGPGDTLVSFNYDLIAERLARRMHKKLRPASVDGARSETITLAKPHGSASWSTQIVGHFDQSPVDRGPVYDSLLPDEIQRGRHPFLLGAVPIKSELIREVQKAAGRPDIFDVVASQWREVGHAVQHAQTLVVAGYGFPPDDEYGRFLISEALRRRFRSNRLRIELFSREETSLEVASRIRELFGDHVVALTPCGPVLPPTSVGALRD
jgi:hypothetical protein